MISRSNKGFGLLIAVAVIFVVAALGTSMLRGMSEALREARRTQDRLKAYLLARGGVEWVRSYPLRPADKNSVEFWDLWKEGRSRKHRDGVIRVKVIDESARLNLTDFLKNLDPYARGVLDRFFASIGLPFASQQAIFDAAPQKEEPGGQGESSARADQGPGNGLDFATVGEVRRLAGSASSWKLLAPYVTVVSAGRTNVNRAPGALLAAFFPTGGDSAAAAIVNTRDARPFSSISALRNELTKAGVQVPGEAAARLTTNTETVTVWSIGSMGEETRAVVASLLWSNNAWVVRSFRSVGNLQSIDDVIEGF
ncbi:MAG: general secretion pathway protein GspK [Candidatus Tectomicrobia bacterium]|nr:general secretion pathway protein GspK [Candidatus Tectomicrobia bacterium]